VMKLEAPALVLAVLGLQQLDQAGGQRAMLAGRDPS
jgi:hypothetical protein